MQEEITNSRILPVQKVYIAPTSLLSGQPEVPSSKYYTLRYLLVATLAAGDSRIAFPDLGADIRSVTQ